ncbi:ChaN family lipoprotein [Massilia yuzhufengensis]|uniref:Haem-binding uptake Tiki superfamily ChaN domain-containing protein n=1 Tax=Massilia yuzhufengensis TaxID=1164594 RepID=A0A1I1PZE7_9BURK|nr:ChaN family lipoprotein [Massilia yuzhufengensis]SFD15042.1 hypothetical protein SAMN05216204_11791 [Massilia yuzhufengensis]
MPTFPVVASLALSALVAASPAQAAPCAALDAVPDAVLGAPLLVLGEVHGTREVPDFVAAYLCAAAQQGRKLTLAIELPSSEQAGLDAFMASPGLAPDVARLIGGGMWRSARQDGRTSAAMLRMLQALHALRAGGADIRLAAIDTDAPSARRDAAMADSLRAALRQGAGRQVVALIGALHATRTRGNRFNPHYESAVYLLADQRLLALTVGTAGGAAWVYRGADPASCQATAWDINRITPAPATPFSLTPPSPQFDGVFYVGATTASPPALQGAATAGEQ